jgi:uncharacterized membrane-anchored protein
MQANIQDTRQLPSWKLWIPLLFQTAIVLGIPAQSFYTSVTGKNIILKTAPVDPYDFLRGYSQTLNYEVSNASNLEKLPGWQQIAPDNRNRYSREKSEIYLILEPPKPTAKPPIQPQPWHALKVSNTLPKSLPDGQVALRGTLNYSRIQYGLERYYMPEAKRDQINEEISQARWGRKPQPIVVEVKVDSQGKSVIDSFWIGDRHYRF